LAAEVYTTALITPIVDALATLMACGRAVDARSLRPYCIVTCHLLPHKFKWKGQETKGQPQTS